MSDQSSGHTMTKEEQRRINNGYHAEAPAEMLDVFIAVFCTCDPGHIPLMRQRSEQSAATGRMIPLTGNASKHLTQGVYRKEKARSRLALDHQRICVDQTETTKPRPPRMAERRHSCDLINVRVFQSWALFRRCNCLV